MSSPSSPASPRSALRQPATWDVWRERPGWACLRPVEGAKVWVIGLPDADVDLSTATLDCLSAGEKERAQRFAQAHHARLYRAAHAALNVLLAQELCCSPADLQIETDAQGKPHLNPPRVHFNLSHSDAWALVAVHAQRPVGVDIEVHTPSRDEEGLAQSVLAPSEWQRWCALDASSRSMALFDAWARKEACIKAWGTGLLTPPEEVIVGVEPRPQASRWQPQPGSCVHWIDLCLPLAHAHSASLAWLER